MRLQGRAPGKRALFFYLFSSVPCVMYRFVRSPGRERKNGRSPYSRKEMRAAVSRAAPLWSVFRPDRRLARPRSCNAEGCALDATPLVPAGAGELRPHRRDCADVQSFETRGVVFCSLARPGPASSEEETSLSSLILAEATRKCCGGGFLRFFRFLKDTRATTDRESGLVWARKQRLLPPPLALFAAGTNVVHFPACRGGPAGPCSVPDAFFF